MAILKIKGSINTDTNELSIEIISPKTRGRPKSNNSRLVALILADAWGQTNFSKIKIPKEQRVFGAFKKTYSDGGSQRRAISQAKKRASELFEEPHKPGEIIYDKEVALWFSDKATQYENEIIGDAWCWSPSLDEAIWGRFKASKKGN